MRNCGPGVHAQNLDPAAMGGVPEVMRDPQELRVAIFSDSMSERNGAGAYYHDLLAQLAPRVGTVEIFQPAQKSRFLFLALPLPGDSTQKLITPNVFRLRRAYKKLQPNVVIAVTPGPFGMLGLWYARRGKTGFITAFHTHFEELVKLYGDTLFFRISHRYLVFINKILCRRSRVVLVNNGDLVKTVKELNAPAVEIMGTPLPPVFLRKEQVSPPKPFRRVLFAGRLAPEKNLPAVMEAARALPDLEFVLAGEGPLRKQLAREAETMPNVRMTGWLEREQLLTEMDQCNVLLLPSYHETFGTVALEAMARGRPALVSEKAGIHHWSVLQDALFTVPTDKPLVDFLRPLQEKEAAFWEDKAAAARRAAEQLNAETIDQWVDLLQRHSS
jgi:glycosyltransferase involved in cell wall biosynthesis